MSTTYLSNTPEKNSEKKDTSPRAPIKRKKWKNKFRSFLWKLFIVELFIFIIGHPEFFGIPFLENFLTNAGTLLRNIFWPVTAEDMNTYKGVIYNICTAVQGLFFFDFLITAASILIPLGLLATYVFPKFQEMNHQAKHSVSNFVKKIISIMQTKSCSGMYARVAQDANNYTKSMIEKCDDPFTNDPGVWIQIFRGTDRNRSYVQHWDESGSMRISGIIEGDIDLVLRNGQAYMDTHQGLRAIQHGTPIVVRRKNRGDQEVNQCVITWL